MAEPGASLVVQAHPRASSDRVGPFAGGVLQVRVARPAAGGEANEAIRRLLARTLGTAPSRVRLAAGSRGRQKRYLIEGMRADELAARLRALDAGN
jgi:uncharacterized protein YggU (UPF0235/DUF167 family)